MLPGLMSRCRMPCACAWSSASADLEGEPDRYIDRELNLSPEAVAKALALNVGHGVPELPSIMAGVEHREDVGML